MSWTTDISLLEDAPQIKSRAQRLPTVQSQQNPIPQIHHLNKIWGIPSSMHATWALFLHRLSAPSSDFIATYTPDDFPLRDRPTNCWPPDWRSPPLISWYHASLATRSPAQAHQLCNSGKHPAPPQAHGCPPPPQPLSTLPTLNPTHQLQPKLHGLLTHQPTPEKPEPHPKHLAAPQPRHPFPTLPMPHQPTNCIQGFTGDLLANPTPPHTPGRVSQSREATPGEPQPQANVPDRRTRCQQAGRGGGVGRCINVAELLFKKNTVG